VTNWVCAWRHTRETLAAITDNWLERLKEWLAMGKATIPV